MTKKSFVSGAIILMLAGFVVRVLGFVYRIYLSNLIGAEGMGLFQLIFPIYSLIILTLTAGISIAVSKMVAEEMAKKRYVNVRRITKCAFIVVMIAGTAVSVLIYTQINFIVNVILKDTRTYDSILFLVPCIPLIAAASALKGYFYGIQEVVPTAVSQVVEQFVKISLVMAMALYFVNISLEYTCALAILGMALGEIANLAVLFVVYKHKKGDKALYKSKKGLKRKRTILKELINTSVPISFNRFITSVMSAVEIILIPRRLLASGLNYQDSIAEFGKLTGMAMPLILFPSLVTSSLATTLVPAISEAASLKNFKAVNHRISKSIQITFVLGFIFTAIFLSYPDEIGNIIYRKESIGRTLYLLGFTCISLYLQQTLLGVLNGLGKQGVSLRNSIIGNTIRIGFVYFCIPLYGVQGYVWGIVISSAVVCILNLGTVMKITHMVLNFRDWVIKPGIVGVVMLFTGKYIYSFFKIFGVGYTWTVILTIAANVVIAINLMIIVGVLQKEEVSKMFGLNFKNRRKH